MNPSGQKKGGFLQVGWLGGSYKPMLGGGHGNMHVVGSDALAGNVT